ncbi:MAG: hypothetical protein WCF43_16460, partial [Steroidobacteraceae bacterium]
MNILSSAFHVAVLKDGAIPLQVLERKVMRWIAAQRTPVTAFTTGIAQPCGKAHAGRMTATPMIRRTP